MLGELNLAAAGDGHAGNDEVSLISCTPDSDSVICAAVVFQYSGQSYRECLDAVMKMNDGEKKRIIKTALSKREFFNSVDRTFETIDFTYELTVSASNYAQLKRHRMSTQIVQDYDPALGFTVPPSITEVNMEVPFREAMDRSAEIYTRIKEAYPDLKNYILTNAHRRRVVLKLNARELYHLVSLREDEHAQWDIRETAARMNALARNAAPLACMMLCGKNSFSRLRDEVFG